MILPLLLALTARASSHAALDSNCSWPAYWELDGRDVMDETRDDVTMIYLLRFDCPGGKPCQKMLTGIRAFAKQIRNSSRYTTPSHFIIIAPPTDRPSVVQYWKRNLMKEQIHVMQDNRDGGVWKVLGGSEYDMFVYDRCGRQAFYVPYPQSEFRMHYPVSVMHKTHLGHPCGHCPTRRPPRRFSREFPAKGVTPPPVVPPARRTPPPRVTQPTTPRRRIQVFFVNFGAKLRKTSGEDQNSVEIIDNTKKPKVTMPGAGWEVTSWPVGEPGKSGERTSKAPVVEKPGTSEETGSEDYKPIYEDDDEKTTKNPDIIEIEEPEPEEPTPEPETGSEEEIKKTKNTGVEGGAEVPDSGEPEPEEPEEPEPEEPRVTTTTVPTTTTTTAYPFTHPDYDCSQFTDEKCYQDQQQGEVLHPCCFKGVYLTDMCHSSNCSADTYDLCCFQRFQQSRYRCCQDPNVKCDRPDEFSRCCYDLFTADIDPCCPQTLAEDHWSVESKIVEYCLPNVYLDYGDAELKYKHEGRQHSIRLSQPINRLDFQCLHQQLYPTCKPYYYLPEAPRDEDEE